MKLQSPERHRTIIDCPHSGKFVRNKGNIVYTTEPIRRSLTQQLWFPVSWKRSSAFMCSRHVTHTNWSFTDSVDFHYIQFWAFSRFWMLMSQIWIIVKTNFHYYKPASLKLLFTDSLCVWVKAWCSYINIILLCFLSSWPAVRWNQQSELFLNEANQQIYADLISVEVPAQWELTMCSPLQSEEAAVQ